MSKVKAACAALPGEILNADLDIDISDDLKTLLTDPAYCNGVEAMESLFMTIRFCLTYLEGDETTFSAVYACFVAIKFHIQILDPTVMGALQLNDSDIVEMITLGHQRFSIIYTELHALAFPTDPLFNTMRTLIAAKFGEEFLHIGKGSISQKSKAAVAHISMGNENFHRFMLSEFAEFVIRKKDTDDDFSDVKFKPSQLWTLCDESIYGSIKGPLSALHKNPAGASGGERKHKAAKRGHSRNRARLGQSKIETATAILYNSRQLARKLE